LRSRNAYPLTGESTISALPFSPATLVMLGTDATTMSGPASSWPTTVTFVPLLKRRLTALSIVPVRMSVPPARSCA
jgi:hypothetical protein